MKIYIAGPMTGYEKFNFPAFDAARDDFEACGFEVFSPADHDRHLLGKPLHWLPEASDSEGPWQRWSIPGAPSLRRMMSEDLQWIADNADEVYMLRGWEKSSGARVEHALAVCLGLKIDYEGYYGA